jgi:hypothetical protein
MAARGLIAPEIGKMRGVIARLICWLFGHDVWESPYSRRHRCERCGREFAD